MTERDPETAAGKPAEAPRGRVRRQSAGRPTLLDESVMATIVDLLERGNTYSATARAAGLHPQTVSDWVARGRELIGRDPEGLDEKERLFLEFATRVEKARAIAEVRAVERVRQAGETQWQAAAWYLERSNPGDWGRVQRSEVSGPGGAPVRVDVESVSRKLGALIDAVVVEQPALGD